MTNPGRTRERSFLDTNVLVYARDRDAGRKSEQAREVLQHSLSTRTGVLSTQVLQEFFVIATRKLGVDARVARREIELLSALDVVRLGLDHILGAIDVHRLHGIAFWDALILRAASSAGCTRVLTEDLQDGQVIDGVRIEDPFRSR